MLTTLINQCHEILLRVRFTAFDNLRAYIDAMKLGALILCLLYFISYGSGQDNNQPCGGWRLPRNVLPSHYDITIKIPENSGAERFTGSVIIDVLCLQPTDTIVFHYKGLAIAREKIIVEPKSVSGEILQVIGGKSDDNLDTFELKLDGMLQNGTTYVLNIPKYSGEIMHYSGPGLGAIYDYSSDKVAYATFFEPASARTVFPSFDEPNMKATFTMRVERSAGYKSFSNMPLNKTVNLSRKRFLDTFERTPPISTYNVAIAVLEDFGSYPRNGTTRTRIIVPENDVDSMATVYQVADDALRKMEEYTGIRFPLSKIEHVSVKYYPYEGMEHWGLVIYQRGILMGMVASQVLEKEKAVNVLIHEVAHQWFGNLVTLDWWSHFWLNEAFPTYFQYYIGNQLFPDWRLPDRFIVSEFQKALDYDGERYGDRAIPLTNKRLCDVKRDFQSLVKVSYSKGSSILKMFEAILGGERLFQQALQIFLKNRKLRNVVPNDLFQALDEVNSQLPKSNLPQNVTFKQLGQVWTEQAGVPVVTVTRNYTARSAYFKQEQFYDGKPLKGINYTSRWWIPLTWTTASSPGHQRRSGAITNWLHADKTIEIHAGPNDWLLLNTNVTGYYRVNYDEENWSLLSQALKTSPELFSTANRAQLLNDAFALSFAGQLKFDIALNLTRFLFEEKDPVVWLSATEILKRAFKYASFSDNMFDSDHKTKRYIRRLMTKAYNSVKVRGKPKDRKETYLDKVMRESIREFCTELRVQSRNKDEFFESLPDWVIGPV